MEGTCGVIVRRGGSLVVLLFMAIVPAPVKLNRTPVPPRQESRDTTAHWVAQYRSPRSLDKTGSDLALFSFNSISIVSPDVFFVGADMPEWSAVGGRAADLKHRYAVVFKTTDGGKTWKETSLVTGLDISALNSIHFANASIGVAVGVDSEEKSVICNTIDGGASWTGSRLAFQQAPASVWIGPSGRGWMSGVTSPKGKSEEDAYEEGGPSDILATTDFGRSWHSQKHVPVSINTLAFANEKTGWAGGNPAAIYHTSDGGRTWDRQRTRIESQKGLQIARGARQFSVTGMSFTDVANGWAAIHSETREREGRIIGTTNGGKTWSQLWTTGGEKLRAVFFMTPHEGWATTDDGQYVYHTADGGRSWQSEPIDFVQNVPLYQIAASDPWHVWAVGGGGIFLRVSE